MTMSQKDKNTIILAVVALLIFGICFLGIKPAFTNLKEAKAANTELSAQRDTMKTEIASLPTYKTNLDAAKANYDTTANRVFPDSDNDELHDIIVDKLVKPLGLQINSLSIVGRSTQSVATYSTKDDAPMGGPTEGTINMASVSVSVYGTLDQLIAFVDELNTTEGIYFQGVGFANTAEPATISVSFEMVLADTFK